VLSTAPAARSSTVETSVSLLPYRPRNSQVRSGTAAGSGTVVVASSTLRWSVCPATESLTR
jgi:hypothetical protein